MEAQVKYTAKYFSDNMPDWKKKKDSILCRLLYRKISFHISAFAANHGISANTVSYLSAIEGIIACILFLIPNYYSNIAGAFLINLWVILDCVDGNLARSVKKQPFGGFADGISSYILVAFMCTCMGFAVYNDGGFFFSKNNVLIVLIGAIASTSDTLMRLIYQKYKSNERELADQGILTIQKDVRNDHSKVNSIRVRIESELGLGALCCLVLLIMTIIHALDIMVLFYFFYYGLSCVVSSLLLIRKAILAAQKYEIKEDHAS